MTIFSKFPSPQNNGRSSWKAGSLDRQTPEQDVTHQRGRAHGHPRRRCLCVHGKISNVREAVGRSSAGRMESLGFDSFLQSVFLQLSRDAAVSMRMRSTDAERLFRKLGHIIKRKSLLVGTEENTERFSKVTCRRDDLLIRLHDCKVSQENWERKLLEQDVVLKQ